MGDYSPRLHGAHDLRMVMIKTKNDQPQAVFYWIIRGGRLFAPLSARGGIPLGERFKV